MKPNQADCVLSEGYQITSISVIGSDPDGKQTGLNYFVAEAVTSFG